VRNEMNDTESVREGQLNMSDKGGLLAKIFCIILEQKEIIDIRKRT